MLKASFIKPALSNIQMKSSTLIPCFSDETFTVEKFQYNSLNIPS